MLRCAAANEKVVPTMPSKTPVMLEQYGQSVRAWNTRQEMWYLERLGLHRYSVSKWPNLYNKPVIFEIRKNGIEKYCRYMGRRDDWSFMDYHLLKDYAEYERNRLETEGTAFDLNIIDLMNLTNPLHAYEHLLSTKDREEAHKRNKLNGKETPLQST